MRRPQTLQWHFRIAGVFAHSDGVWPLVHATGAFRRRRKIMMLAAQLACATTVCACAADTESIRAEITPAATLDMSVAAAGEEQTKLRALVGTFEGILRQEKLWTNFNIVAEQFPRIYIGPAFSADGTATPAQAIALLRGQNSDYVHFSAQITLTGTYYNKGLDFVGRCRNPSGTELGCRAAEFRQNYSNMLAVTHGINLPAANGREITSIEIGREIFARYNSTAPVRQSCTYNTLAHEWTHTIGRTQAAHRAVVEDTDVAASASMPQLSYFFGAVAQCTWLQGQPGASQAQNDLRACVTRFSAVPFPDSLCT